MSETVQIAEYCSLDVPNKPSAGACYPGTLKA